MDIDIKQLKEFLLDKRLQMDDNMDTGKCAGSVPGQMTGSHQRAERLPEGKESNMFRQMISFVPVAGLLLALAPTAQAASVNVNNHSFEAPAIVADGEHATDPSSWTVTNGGNIWSVGLTWGAAFGPTDGD